MENKGVAGGKGKSDKNGASGGKQEKPAAAVKNGGKVGDKKVWVV